MKSKTEVAYQTISAIAGNRNFKGINEMMESCIISIITYSMEACNPTTVEVKNTGRNMETIISRTLFMLMVPPNSTKKATLHRDGPA